MKKEKEKKKIKNEMKPGLFGEGLPFCSLITTKIWILIKEKKKKKKKKKKEEDNKHYPKNDTLIWTTLDPQL